MTEHEMIGWHCRPDGREFDQTLCDPVDCSSLGSPILHCLSEFDQTHVHQVGNAIQSSHALSSPLLLPLISPSIRIFSSESTLCIRWPKYWSFSLSISLSNEYSGLISFRIDWFDLLAVQGTFSSLLQHHSSKASILWCSVFFMVQLSHPYMTPGEAMTLTIWTFVGRMMSLLFSTLFRFAIAFLPRSKHLLNSWLQSLSTVILEPKKIKSVRQYVLYYKCTHTLIYFSHMNYLKQNLPPFLPL